MAEGVEQALVQRLLRGTEVCSLAASARLKNEDGKTVPIIIALVSSRESPHELSLFVIKVASGVFGRSALYKCFAVNTDLGIEKNSTNSTLTVAFNQEFLVFEGISADIQEQIDASCQASVAALIAMRSPTGTMEHAWLKCYADEQLDKSEMDMAGDSPGQLDVPLAGIRNPSNFSSFRVNAVNRLLKQRKAEFSTSTRITVHVCTWNVNAKFPDEDITPWLQATMEPQPEVIAVGLQEMVELNTQNLILTDNTRAMEWQMHLNKILNSGPHVYEAIARRQLVGVYLVVFVRGDHSINVSDVRSESVGCGLGGWMGNKGGIGVRFNLCDTSICFVNSHLDADKERVDGRNADMNEIYKQIAFKAPDSPVLGIPDHDVIIWLGDLNYRVSHPFDQVKTIIAQRDWPKLLKFDQLTTERKAKRCFIGFEEGPVTFAPTYKYELGEDRYDASDKRRVPSWCDRVLFQGTGVACKNYGM
eukprot:c19708_g1_i2.p1 GENE.c19708_g1_i2~~c19708_g1_i2.p1  ORF type:complete len:475 (+),score=119.39 c19708_g1_i2:41-1465(+)